jgi:hypothetical protein
MSSETALSGRMELLRKEKTDATLTISWHRLCDRSRRRTPRVIKNDLPAMLAKRHR